jgi:tetratricopeptide (TPR) repeat protein
VLEATLARHRRAGRDDERALMCLHNLAEAYRQSGQPARAVPLFEQALPNWEPTFGPKHPDALSLRTNLAMAYSSTGQHDKALPLLEQVLETHRAGLGPDHVKTLIATTQLAVACLNAGRPERTRTLLEEALDRMKAKFGPDHLYTLNSMSTLADAYRATDRLDLALPLSEEALKLMKPKLGTNHPNTLVAMSNLALAYHAAGKSDLAAPLIRAAAEGMEKLRFQHELAWLLVHNLSATLEEARQFGEAEAWRRKGLAVVKERFGADSELYAGQLGFLGRNLLRQQKWADAEAALRDSLAIRAQREPDDWRTFDTRSLLGGALLGQKKYAEAEPLLALGYEGLKRHRDQIRPPGLLAAALERLVQLYAATGRPDKAAEYRQELESVKKK